MQTPGLSRNKNIPRCNDQLQISVLTGDENSIHSLCHNSLLSQRNLPQVLDAYTTLAVNARIRYLWSVDRRNTKTLSPTNVVLRSNIPSIVSTVPPVSLERQSRRCLPWRVPLFSPSRLSSVEYSLEVQLLSAIAPLGRWGTGVECLCWRM